jgi:hypothetical protein
MLKSDLFNRLLARIAVGVVMLSLLPSGGLMAQPGVDSSAAEYIGRFLTDLKQCRQSSFVHAPKSTTVEVKGKQGDRCLVTYTSSSQPLSCRFSAKSLKKLTNKAQFQRARKGQVEIPPVDSSVLAECQQPSANTNGKTVVLFDRSAYIRDMMSVLESDKSVKPNPTNLASVIQGMGSMGRIKGKTETPEAAAALDRWASLLANRNDVAIRFFGGDFKKPHKANCSQSKLAVPFGQATGKQQLIKLLQNTRTKGFTRNIHFALRQASKDLGAAGGRVVLISNGLETCGKDLYGLAKKLAQKKIQIDVIAVGRPDRFGAGSLGQLALLTGGQLQLAVSDARKVVLPKIPKLPGSVGEKGAGLVLAGSPPSGDGQAGELKQPDLPMADTGDLALPEGSEAKSGKGASFKVGSDDGGKNGALVVGTEAPADSPPKDASEQPATANTAIELILDVSGSMEGKIGGVTKMKLARKAFKKTLSGLDDPQFLVGLRAYGFDRSVPKTRKDSCPNTVLLERIVTSNLQRIQSRADTLYPYGYTPIAQSLLLAADDLQAVEADQHAVILISDGEETCGGDPVAAARRLCAMGIGYKAHVVGFDLEAKAAAQMRAVAKAGCGTYRDARDADQLTESLTEIITEVKEAAPKVSESDDSAPNVTLRALAENGSPITQRVGWELTHGEDAGKRYGYFKQQKKLKLEPGDYSVRVQYGKLSVTKAVSVPQSGEVVVDVPLHFVRVQIKPELASGVPASKAIRSWEMISLDQTDDKGRPVKYREPGTTGKFHVPPGRYKVRLYWTGWKYNFTQPELVIQPTNDVDRHTWVLNAAELSIQAQNPDGSKIKQAVNYMIYRIGEKKPIEKELGRKAGFLLPEGRYRIKASFKDRKTRKERSVEQPINLKAGEKRSLKLKIGEAQ